MRFFEIASGMRVPVSKEEQEIIDLIKSKGGSIEKASIDDERTKEVARKMVSRGVLKRSRIDDKTILSLDSASDIWRY
jgi:hypothetical protein